MKRTIFAAVLLTAANDFFAMSVRISETEYVGLSLNAGVSYLDGRFSQLARNNKNSCTSPAF